ncbi:Alpha/Beta hydrolase protein [Thamnocephalis sphaerospora]|uniref:Alpha/Beta hydrolase protein n=1 Tax=Thamnocephalis sphaerospora TaxID=78915 RepID=A0A4V1IVQ5_9FUNG|nr:Alpha/Beta hydrolase protein [Thamnocephalis sphaerospora]|eukprot:RKP04879.1 Alpha/Beta hydrolase protein [Thamnocephalis sphaerospora]
MAQAKVQMSQLVAKYIMELRNRQPRGPYNLGGWSAGGICAFEASRQLQEAGEVVQSLILIDSPNPIGLQNPPARIPEMKPNDPREMIWLINNRTDFAADGWASLVGREKLTVEVLDNVNHFTMMDRGPEMSTMSSYIRRSLSSQV